MANQTNHHLHKNDEEAVVLDYSTIESHPNEILTKIFEHLPIINRVAIGRVSKRVLKVTADINGKVKSLVISDRRPDWRPMMALKFCAIEDHKFGDNWICTSSIEQLVDIIKALPHLKALDVSHPIKDLRPILEDFPKTTNIEHIHFSNSKRISSLDFAISHLGTSKVTCISDECHLGAYGEKISNLKSLKYFKSDKEIGLDDARTLLKMNVVSLEVDFGHLETIAEEQFWIMLFENGMKVEELHTCVMVDRHLHKVIEGGLPRLKHITFEGDVNDLEKVLRLPNIESMRWEATRGAWVTVADIRDAIRVNGRKLKTLEAYIDSYDETEPQFELKLLKTIAENCPNLEHLYLPEVELTSKDMLELPLGQLLPHLLYLGMEVSSCDPFEVYELFSRMPSLIGFKGATSGVETLYGHTLALERRGDYIIDINDDTELKPPAPQPS